MNPRRAFSRLGWHLVLAFVMLLMQQAGWRHSLEHITHDDDAAPTHAACLLCVAHHVQDHAMGSTPSMAVPLSFAGHVLRATPERTPYLGGVWLHYQSRAPPSVVSA